MIVDSALYVEGRRVEGRLALEHVAGYPAVLALMLVVCGLMYRFFRRSGWL